MLNYSLHEHIYLYSEILVKRKKTSKCETQILYISAKPLLHACACVYVDV